MAEQQHVPSNAGHAHGAHGDPDPEIVVSPVAKVLVAIAVIGLVAAALMWPLVHGLALANRERQDPTQVDASRPLSPLLQAHPEQELSDFRARERVALGSYGWIDESTGIARVPVERAAELVLGNGLALSSAELAAGGSSSEEGR